jgi:cell division protein FtsL
MNKSYHDESNQEVVVNMAKKLSGYDDANLTRIADEAEKAWQQKLADDPDLAAKFEQDADRQFEALMAKVHESGIQPMTEEQYAHEQSLDNSAPVKILEKERKKFRFSKKIIAGLAAAALIVVGGSMVSVGKNGYRYNEYPDMSKMQAKRYNTSISDIADTVDDFYDLVKEQLGIPVIVMDDYPSDMYLESIISKQDSITAQFEYNGEHIYLKEAKPEPKNILKMEVSDRKDVKTFYNKWVGLDLSIKESILNNDRKEYSVSINTEEGYYLLEGVMNLDEFYEIVLNLIYR